MREEYENGFDITIGKDYLNFNFVVIKGKKRDC
jgi:hypothetical protein